MRLWRLVTLMIAGFFVNAFGIGQTGAPRPQVDPIIGAWKMNLSASKISPVLQEVAKIAPPKQRTEVYRQTRDGQIELTSAFIGTDGSSISLSKVFPSEGGMGKQANSQPGELSFDTRVSPTEWYVTVLQDGKQTLTIHKVISQDGKTMRETVKGVDSKGKPFEELRVFERQ